MRIALAALLLMAGAAHAADWSSITNADASAGMKGALVEGAGKAVSLLGTENGYFGNPKVKIPLPPAIARAESALRMMGMKKQADELVLAMNRAAEAAVPEARALLVESVQKMTVQDAKQILTGGDTAATEYFRRTTEAQLNKRFLPIVKQTTDRVGLAQQYNSLAGQVAQFGVLGKDEATVEQYVTKKALDGLYLTIGEQERALRTNPAGAASSMVQKVFGALK